ncbi:hypothetical protein EVA_14081 [gut metagenome]|uniref:Uncharacterized protein n=1 Tax=gut metagenome TaxID=749906 RepID=J9GEM7_9ZZZZ
MYQLYSLCRILLPLPVPPLTVPCASVWPIQQSYVSPSSYRHSQPFQHA